MKRPEFDWENSSREFRDAFNEWPQYRDLSRDDVEEIITADLARAQRMASAGLRHLRAILGANTDAGIRDRWRRDALAVPYFGKTSSVANMKAVRRRLERAHRRLRDDRLHIRMRRQSQATTSTTDGRNETFFLAPRRFQLFPDFARNVPESRSTIIVHELLHEWLRDQKIGNNTIYNESEVRRLASRDPEKARRNPANYERFLLQVWEDEGLDRPTGAIREGFPMRVAASVGNEATGALADRPVVTAGAGAAGRRDLVFCALRAQAGDELVPSVFEVDATPIQRRGPHGGALGAISYPPALCTLGNGLVVAATRSPRSRRMELRAWDIVEERAILLADSGTLFRDTFSQPDVVALEAHRFCLVYKIKNGRMRVELMEYTRDGGFERLAHAETSGPIRDHGRAVLVRPVSRETGAASSVSGREFVVATVFRTREGRLSFDLWDLDTAPRRVTRRGGLVDHEITGRPGVALARRAGLWTAVAAARDKRTGRLRLTAYDVGDVNRPKRLGDSGEAGPRMTHSPDIVSLPHEGALRVATACRYVESSRMIVSLWDPSDGERLFRRTNYSGHTTGPLIKGSPSLEAFPGRAVPTLTSSAVAHSGGLAMHRWEAG